MKAKNPKLLSILLTLASVGESAELSPEHWASHDREALEKFEEQGTPQSIRKLETKNGMISATLSPVSIRAGIETLKEGGTAADAAAAVALTQISRALGSYVSYAGIFQLLYFEKKSGKITSIDSGWASYQNENANRKG